MLCAVGVRIIILDVSRREEKLTGEVRTERNTAQIRQTSSFVSRSAPQVHPIFLLKPIRYPAPHQPATVIRPILTSNVNLPISRPPFVRRLLRPTIIRPVLPRLPTNEKPLTRTEPVTIQRRAPIRESSTESSISTISTISSKHEELPKKKEKKPICSCCRPKAQESHRLSTPNYPNLKLKPRSIYILIILLFIFFLIVIILLIVLIVVRR